MFLKTNPKITNSLAFRLTLSYAAIASLFSIIAFGIFYYKLTLVTMEAVDAEIFEEVEELTDIFLEAGIEGVKTEIAEENQSEDTQESFFRLFDDRGHIITSTDMSAWGAVPFALDISTKPEDVGDSGHIETLQLPGREYKTRIITLKIASDLILQHGQTIAAAQEYLGIFRQLFGLVLLISLLLAGITGGLMAKRALHGVNQVAQTAQLIAKGQYHERVQVGHQYNEINHLADTFNIMVDRIQDLVERMREVTENIAHDLRSPLARIRGIAEMSLISKSAAMTPAQAAESTIEECDHLIETINTMLDLTEIEAGVQTLDVRQIRLNQLLEDACELFRPLAHESDIKVELDLNEQITLHTDGSRLQRLIYNLLDNAIKYSPLNGHILIKAHMRDRRVQIEVEDNGSGIAQDDLPYIFDRFYRADRSRSKPGAGLGLSLVKAITNALGGSIKVNSRVNKGSRFSITLPQLQMKSSQLAM